MLVRGIVSAHHINSYAISGASKAHQSQVRERVARQIQEFLAHGKSGYLHLDVALECRPVEESYNARRCILEGLVRGPRTFVELLDYALYHMFWYNHDSASGVVF